MVLWLWGGFSVENPTLTRFCALHYNLPWLIVGFSLLHISALHVHGSLNPLGLESKYDTISFYPYYVLKDLFAILCFFLIWMFLVFFMSNLLGHPDNYIKANPLVTPAMICPEWYFLGAPIGFTLISTVTWWGSFRNLWIKTTNLYIGESLVKFSMLVKGCTALYKLFSESEASQVNSQRWSFI